MPRKSVWDRWLATAPGAVALVGTAVREADAVQDVVTAATMRGTVSQDTSAYGRTSTGESLRDIGCGWLASGGVNLQHHHRNATDFYRTHVDTRWCRCHARRVGHQNVATGLGRLRR